MFGLPYRFLKGGNDEWYGLQINACPGGSLLHNSYQCNVPSSLRQQVLSTQFI